MISPSHGMLDLVARISHTRFGRGGAKRRRTQRFPSVFISASSAPLRQTHCEVQRGKCEKCVSPQNLGGLLLRPLQQALCMLPRTRGAATEHSGQFLNALIIRHLGDLRLGVSAFDLFSHDEVALRQ